MSNIVWLNIGMLCVSTIECRILCVLTFECRMSCVSTFVYRMTWVWTFKCWTSCGSNVVWLRMSEVVCLDIRLSNVVWLNIRMLNVEYLANLTQLLRTKMGCKEEPPCKDQGPVVQSVVSLKSSLRVILLTVLADSIYNIPIFFAEQIWVAFVKATHIFFSKKKQKKKQHICVSLDVKYNESLTNDVVSFKQLGPGE